MTTNAKTVLGEFLNCHVELPWNGFTNNFEFSTGNLRMV